MQTLTPKLARHSIRSFQQLHFRFPKRKNPTNTRRHFHADLCLIISSRRDKNMVEQILEASLKLIVSDIFAIFRQ